MTDYFVSFINFKKPNSNFIPINFINLLSVIYSLYNDLITLITVRN